MRFNLKFPCREQRRFLWLWASRSRTMKVFTRMPSMHTSSIVEEELLSVARLCKGHKRASRGYCI